MEQCGSEVIISNMSTYKKNSQSEERYMAFINNSQEGIWRIEVEQPISTSLSPDKQIDLMYKHAYLAEANEAMARMYGFQSAKELIGARLGDFLIRDDPRNTEYLKAFIDSGYNLSGIESHEQDRDGNDKFFRNSLIGIIEKGKIVRGWGTQQDVTQQRFAEMELQKSEERLDLTLKASNMGTWEWDIVSDTLTWSPKLKEIFGLKPTAKITYEKYRSMLHPDTAPDMQRKIQHSLKTGESYKIEHKIIWPNGSVHWMLGQGQAILENGKPVRMLGTSMNIDDVKRTQKLKAINVALKTQRRELMQLNRSKDEFISLASHQLRTPATGVKQYIGMLLEGYAGVLDERQRSLLAVAYESNERQLAIIDDLLKVAHIDAGKVVLQKHETNLGLLISDILNEQVDTFKARCQHVEFSPPSQPVKAMVDKQRIRMVIENLTDNASKYSPKGKTIRIELVGTEDKVEIKIIDQGVGIPKEDMRLLFQKFSRVENPLSADVGGSGLGLYWAKRIVDLHNGTIKVTSKPELGSTFSVALPRSSS